MSLEAWVILCTTEELNDEIVVATKENAFYICAAKPIWYFLDEERIQRHKLGKAVNFKTKGYQHEDSDGVLTPIKRSGKKLTDPYGDPITYVYVKDIKPMLDRLNQQCDGPARKRIEALSDDTILALFWE